MAELTPQERLQPSLLDRLTDDDPENHQEGRDSRVMSMARIREAVLRDLRWLLNTSNISGSSSGSPDDPLAGYPHTADSVVNYGMPDLTGYTASGIDEARVEKLVKEAIRRFEPRIVRKLKVVRWALTMSSTETLCLSRSTGSCGGNRCPSGSTYGPRSTWKPDRRA